MQAIILAGGKGSRLKPFTVSIPKPLMPIGDIPILEIVLRQLKYYGFKDVVIAINHMAELIMAFFKNGEQLGLNITYSIEDKALGTAGPLTLINDLEDNFLVMNGDLLTTINYRDLFKYHLMKKSDATISVYNKDVNIDLGVLRIKNDRLVDYIEKPTYHFDVSMGVYVFNKGIVKNIKQNSNMNMPDLILKLKNQKKKISCYKGDYYWLDIGRIDDYETANTIFEKKRREFLPHE